MKTIDLSSTSVSVAELLELARNDSLLVKTERGDSFVVSPTDEFATEVELLRRNHTFMTMLDKFKEDKEEKDLIPLDRVENDLR